MFLCQVLDSSEALIMIASGVAIDWRTALLVPSNTLASQFYSLCSKSDGRVNAGSAPSWRGAGNRRYCHEKQDNPDIREWIEPRDAEEKRLHYLSGSGCACQANAQPHSRKIKSVPQNQLENVTARRAQSGAHADLPDALVNAARKHAIDADGRQHQGHAAECGK